MSIISVVSMDSGAQHRRADDSFKTVGLFCCVGLLTSLALTAFGVDVGASWI